jgi:hypothetical protein
MIQNKVVDVVVNTAAVVNDIQGKINAAPMSAVGLTAAGPLYIASKLTGKGGDVEFANNAISFTTGLRLGGAITLGNVIIYANYDWNKYSSIERYDNYDIKVNLGRHEEAHTYQYQQFGVLMIPMLLTSSVINSIQGKPPSNDFIGRSSLEKAADDYAQGLIGRSNDHLLSVFKKGVNDFVQNVRNRRELSLPRFF